MDKRVLFSEQLSNLLDSGIPLIECLELLSDQKVIPKEAGQRLMLALEQGSSFSEALEREKFPGLFVSFIRAAEEHGNYAFGLKQCSAYDTAQAKWMRELGQACTYPFMVLLLVGAALVFMITAVLPRFAELYQAMGIQLPWMTKILLTGTDVLRFLLLTSGAGVCIVLILTGIARNLKKETRLRFSSLLFRLPLVRTLYRYRLTHYLSVQLGSLLRAGVPILAALELMETLAPWEELRIRIKRMKQQLMQGASLHQSIAICSPDLFLPSLNRMVAIGEKSGRLDEALLSLARMTEHLIKNKLDKFIRSLEPVLIFVIGCFIAVTVIAMFLPMLELVRAI
ncbi:type II secretion system F family protein [Lihuaxuella thermophila]|uniref:General secretion pathway protein F/protein transport protein HofC n=1 Tax=Lihuaxuella thermophila TaxID=1173111 RepID=A0A1H8DGZ2_9BACL|nr:type II secretion system F family protein [Lihuaxuella thermophila]SEN06445.1 general secretion pathway protein F/protein transport protein HofC [Lihuaxuella thermophila]